MSRFLTRIRGLFKSGTQVGIDKAGNRYFTRSEEVDGIMKERRWVTFKGEEDPTSVPVEWICWLNGQRKKAPTPEEMMELEARRERVKLNIAKLQKEEEEEKLKRGVSQPSKTTGKVGPPDLASFIKQFPGAPFDPSSGTLIQPMLKLLRQKLQGCQYLQNQLVVASPLSQERGSHHHEKPFQSVWLIIVINLQLTVRPLYHKTPCQLTS